jgi:hypothetical protein
VGSYFASIWPDTGVVAHYFEHFFAYLARYGGAVVVAHYFDRIPGRAAEKEVIRHHNDDTKRPRTYRCVMDGRISGRISKVNPEDHPTQQ